MKMCDSHSGSLKVSPDRDICRDKRDILKNRDVPVAGHFGTSPRRGMSECRAASGRDILR
jgi:hypothetical protein